MKIFLRLTQLKGDHARVSKPLFTYKCLLKKKTRETYAHLFMTFIRTKTTTKNEGEQRQEQPKRTKAKHNRRPNKRPKRQEQHRKPLREPNLHNCTGPRRKHPTTKTPFALLPWPVGLLSSSAPSLFVCLVHWLCSFVS